MEIAQLRDVLLDDDLLITLQQYCAQEFGVHDGRQKIARLLSGQAKSDALNTLNNIMSWNDNDVYKLLGHFERAMVSFEDFVKTTSTPLWRRILLNRIKRSSATRSSSLTVPKDWHHSWTGFGSPRYCLVNLIGTYAADINKWIQAACEESFPGIYQNPRTGMYQYTSWVDDLLSKPKTLESFINFISNCKITGGIYSNFDSFWNQWTELEVMPYLVGIRSPALLAQPRPSSVEERPVNRDMDRRIFRNLCVVDESIEYSTIAQILDQLADTPILQVLNIRTSNVAEWLHHNPHCLHLIVIALIRAGKCVPYSPVQRRLDNPNEIIQYRVSEEELIRLAIDPIINGYPLKQLANFLGNPAEDEKTWRGLFNGVVVESLKELLVTYGKKRAELSLWPDQKFIEYMSEFDGIVSPHRRYAYRMDLLRILRERPVPVEDDLAIFLSKMFPWLHANELQAWLNPPKPTTPRILVVDPIDLSTPPSKLREFLKVGGIDAPDFIAEYERLDLDFEDLGMAIEGFVDKELEPLRAMLTLKQRMKIKRLLQAQT